METQVMLHLDQRIFCYQLLVHYYRGDLNNRTYKEWHEISKLVKEQVDIAEVEHIKTALKLLEQMTSEDLEEFEYTYNRLFIGPGRLLAPPFESSYRNFEKATMQQETMKVRNFYHYVGMQVANEGQMPDDHIQFELEFILYLLSSEEQGKNSIYKLFLENHLLQWSDKHIEDILQNTTNKIALAFAYFLKGFLQLEKWMIEGGE